MGEGPGLHKRLAVTLRPCFDYVADGEVRWTTGTLYPLLHNLENKGLVESFWRPAEAGVEQAALGAPGGGVSPDHVGRRSDYTLYEFSPIGFKTLQRRLGERGHDVKIVNLSTLLLRYPRIDISTILGALEVRLLGIDLHWMVHVQGSLEVTGLRKRGWTTS